MYNSDINIIGSIPDYHLIYKALPLLIGKEDQLKKLLVTDNEFNLRTEKSRKRFLAVLNSAFVSENQDINLLTAKLIEHLRDDEQSQALILFWLFSMNNDLFFELNRDVFLKFYFQGRAELPKQDVVAYLKDLISRNEDLKGKWSEKTIDIIASKYLTLLKKLHLLEGTQKKSFCFVSVSDELLAVFMHILNLLDNRKSNILEDEFLPFSFVPPDSITERLKKIAKKGWIKMYATGTSIRVEASFNTNNMINGIFG